MDLGHGHDPERIRNGIARIQRRDCRTLRGTVLLGVLGNSTAIEGPILHRGLLQLVRKPFMTQTKTNLERAIGYLTNNACASAVDIAEDNHPAEVFVESVGDVPLTSLSPRHVRFPSKI